jgi:glycosyltransferase involved in cell wall biosynthesis
MNEPVRGNYVVCRALDARSSDETIAHIANRAASRDPDADLVLVLEGLDPPREWLAQLRACAEGESTTATVTALLVVELGGGGTGNGPLYSPSGPSGDASALAPRVNLVSGPCVYITRAGFDLLGGMDEALRTSAAAVAEFGLRARERGLANLLANHALVSRYLAPPLSGDDRATLERRFPTSWAAAVEPPSDAVERSHTLARTAFRKLTVTIDARVLGANLGGTQVYAIQLIRALARTGEVQIRALASSDAQTRAELEALENTSVITYDDALAGAAQTDLVHRPQQVFTVDDLALLRPLGRRLVITHLDLIAYHNATYFAEFTGWQRHVRATRLSLSAADRTLFLSSHARQDAEREDLVDRQRTSIVPLGIDLSGAEHRSMTQPPALVDRGEPFLLCLGADYSHKNRLFALDLIAELRRNHGWPGTLVLAGPHAEHGSSADAERCMLEARPDLENAVIQLGPISESERRWLMSHTRAVVYPTVLEGFGLLPFEAGAAGVPCLFASQSSLAELIPPEYSTLDGWNVASSAAKAARLLSDDSARDLHIDGLRRAAREYTWDLCAERTIEAYRETLKTRISSSHRQAWEALEREGEIVRMDREIHELGDRIGGLQHAIVDQQAKAQALMDSFGADAIALVGPNGFLSSADQRALLAVTVRPTLRRPLLASLRIGYRLVRRGRD